MSWSWHTEYCESFAGMRPLVYTIMQALMYTILFLSLLNWRCRWKSEKIRSLSKPHLLSKSQRCTELRPYWQARIRERQSRRTTDLIICSWPYALTVHIWYVYEKARNSVFWSSGVSSSLLGEISSTHTWRGLYEFGKWDLNESGLFIIMQALTGLPYLSLYFSHFLENSLGQSLNTAQTRIWMTYKDGDFIGAS